jgi:hypothetical protein
LASCQDYYGIKKSLRVPPVSEIRKDCRQIIRGLEGGEKDQGDKTYEKFITSLEAVDLWATRGIQSGDLKDDGRAELQKNFQDTEKYLDDFLALVLASRFGQYGK